MEINIAGPDGNVFVIMGVARKLLEDTHRGDEIPLAMKRMQLGTYGEALAVATEVSNGSITFYDSRKDDD